MHFLFQAIFPDLTNGRLQEPRVFFVCLRC